MSNDLSNQLRSLNTFEWMARPATTKQICFDAADRIEKLEKDIGILSEANHRLCGRIDYIPYADRIEKLEAALREIAALGFWDGDSAMNIARKALEGKDD
jgi:hypothetical protein